MNKNNQNLPLRSGVGIVVLNKENKAPYVVIEHVMNLNFNVSISHEEEYAIAFALIQK